MLHYLETKHGPLSPNELVLDRKVYVLPEGTTLEEARRIGSALVEEPR